MKSFFKNGLNFLLTLLFLNSLSFAAQAQTDATTEKVYDPYGQHELRDRWQNLPPELSTQEVFLRHYFLIDIAESRWSNSLRAHPLETDHLPEKPHDLDFLVWNFDHQLGKAPFRALDWMKSILAILDESIQNPYPAIRSALQIFHQQILPPLTFSLILCLIVYLVMWTPALNADLPFKNRPRGSLPWVILGGGGLIAAALLSNLWIYAMILLAAAITYSRKPTAFVVLALVVGAAFDFSFFYSALEPTWNQMEIKTAFNRGRTRIEYSDSALQSLSPLEKAIWSDLNGDSQNAQNWFAQIPTGRAKAMLAIAYRNTPPPPEEQWKALQKYEADYGRDPILLFNQHRVLVKMQNLIQADEVRAALGEEQFLNFSEKLTHLDQNLLYPPIADDFGTFESLASEALQKRLSDLGLIPFKIKRGGPLWILLILPWLLIVFAFWQRTRASGYCSQTGEPTPAPWISRSSAYSAVISARDFSQPTLRQQIDFLSRQYAKKNQFRLRLNRLWLARSDFLIIEHEIWIPFLVNASIWGLVWWSLPNFWQLKVLNLVGMPAPLLLGPTPFIAVFFIAAAILFLSIQSKARKSSL